MPESFHKSPKKIPEKVCFSYGKQTGYPFCAGIFCTIHGGIYQSTTVLCFCRVSKIGHVCFQEPFRKELEKSLVFAALQLRCQFLRCQFSVAKRSIFEFRVKVSAPVANHSFWISPSDIISKYMTMLLDRLKTHGGLTKAQVFFFCPVEHPCHPGKGCG